MKAIDPFGFVLIVVLTLFGPMLSFPAKVELRATAAQSPQPRRACADDDMIF
jgi:hypothetical protein